MSLRGRLAYHHARAVVYTLVLLCCRTQAQESFWTEPHGPGGGSIDGNIVEQPDGDVYVDTHGFIYRLDKQGYWWRRLAQQATNLLVLDNGDLFALDSEQELIRSRDDGATWQRVARPGSGHIADIVRSATGRLVAATESGVLLSSDDAGSWHAPELFGYDRADAVARHGPVLFASSAGSLLYSTDDGLTWSPTQIAPFAGTIVSIRPRRGGGLWLGVRGICYYHRPPVPGGLFVVDGAGPELVFDSCSFGAFAEKSDGTVFANDLPTWDNGEEIGGSLWKIDAEQHIQVTSVGVPHSVLVAADGSVYATTVSAHARWGSYGGRGIWILKDGESEWQQINRGLPHANSMSLATAPGAVYAQVGNRVAMSMDRGVSWTPFPAQPPVRLTSQGVIAAHPSGAVFVTSHQGYGYYGPLVRSLDRGHTWGEVAYEARFVAVTARGTVLRPTSFTIGSPPEPVFGLARSTDLGQTWTDVRVSSAELLDVAAGNDRIVATGSDGTYESRDDGTSWTLLDTFSGLRVAISQDERIVCVIGRDGVYRISADPAIPTGLLPAIDATETIPSATAIDFEGTVYASQNDAIWRLRISDVSWSAIPTPAIRLASHEGRPSIVFDEGGYLYVGTPANSVLRSRFPLRTATDASPSNDAVTAWATGGSPFRESTTFSLELARTERVSLAVYDARGRLIETIRRRGTLRPGFYTMRWRPEAQVSSGIYFYRLEVGQHSRRGSIALFR